MASGRSPRPTDDGELAPHGRETIAIEQAGVDEVSVVPWTFMVPRRLARRVGITRRWATLAVVLAGLFTTSSTITVLVVSLETISRDLGSSVTVLNWSITGPMLAFGVVGPAYGKIGDLYGHKKVYVYGLALSGVFVAMAGTLYAGWVHYIEPPDVFDVLYSVKPIVMALLGGLGSTTGAVIGAFVFLGIEETVWRNSLQIHSGLLGLLVVVLLLFLPQGIVSIGRFARLLGGRRA